MSQNVLFKERTALDFIEYAEEAAAWIKTAQKKGSFGLVWSQSPDSSENFSDYPMLTQKSLYGGSAGVGLFYQGFTRLQKRASTLKKQKPPQKK